MTDTASPLSIFENRHIPPSLTIKMRVLRVLIPHIAGLNEDDNRIGPTKKLFSEDRDIRKAEIDKALDFLIDRSVLISKDVIASESRTLATEALEMRPQIEAEAWLSDWGKLPTEIQNEVVAAFNVKPNETRIPNEDEIEPNRLKKGDSAYDLASSIVMPNRRNQFHALLYLLQIIETLNVGEELPSRTELKEEGGLKDQAITTASETLIKWGLIAKEGSLKPGIVADKKSKIEQILRAFYEFEKERLSQIEASPEAQQWIRLGLIKAVQKRSGHEEAIDEGGPEEKMRGLETSVEQDARESRPPIEFPDNFYERLGGIMEF